MSRAITDRLIDLVGADGVEWSPDHLPRVLPDSTEATARVCREAHAQGWRVRIEGQGHWLPHDTPADLTVSTAALDQVLAVHPADLVATAQAGIPVDQLAHRLASEGVWLATDPPGRAARSLGSVVATGTTGALRHGFGPVRDQVIGCTVVTGDGRIITAGGRVTKNVAGYDLVKLQAGGFGGFGILTELHLRLRSRPRFDLTVTAEGDRDRLTRLARDLEEAGLDAVCCELLSPAAAAAPTWVLALRMAGAESAVRAEQELIAAHDRGMEWTVREGPAGGSFWHAVSHAMGGGAVSARLGVLAGSIDEILDLLHERLDTGLVAAGASRGGLRWCGPADGPSLLALRSHLATREIPMTLERAPWALRRLVGHFGAYREGVGPLVDHLRRQFDPTFRFQATLSGTPGD